LILQAIPKSRAVLPDLKNELRVLELLQSRGKCRNIMELLDSFEDRNSVYVVTPLYTGGELFDRISHQRVFTEADASRHMLDLLTGILHCHEHKVTHRDVKPENLLFSDKSSEAHLLLIDFGMSRIVETPQEELQLQCGSPSYVSPEVLQRNYTMKTDLWSCGVILHILLCGGTPFGNGTDEEILSRVEHFHPDVFLNSLEQPEWANVSKQAKDLCVRLLTKVNQYKFSLFQSHTRPPTLPHLIESGSS
jgi:calcium-dependent protein kinase